ncbi:hypothetical protein BKA62DRAFT_746617 [Auriculariales sp. MPI-PUGE-AT-0066]|nr:hypothetical protein BKA62DRAFT_746617 [Auriculariales sp. MPI-PUGE-AT-0066]
MEPQLPSTLTPGTDLPLHHTTTWVPPGVRTNRRMVRSAKLTPSAFHPDVAAEERLRAWTSPFGVKTFFDFTSNLSIDRQKTRHNALVESVEPATRISYGAGLLWFHEFCDADSMPEDAHIPASEFLLSVFVADACGSVAWSTVDSWVAGLQLWHSVQGAPWLGAHALQSTLKAVKKKVPPWSRREARSPVTDAHMAALTAALSHSDPCDAAILAAARTVYRGCCCLGKLLPRCGRSSTTPITLRGTHFGFVDAAPQVVAHVAMYIPWTKTTHAAGTGADHPAHGDRVSLNRAVPEGATFFAYTVVGGWEALDRGTFMRRCTAIWRSRGLDAALGHSFRIGGCTTLLLLGVHPTLVVKQGRWASSVFLRYFRSIKDLLPREFVRAFGGLTEMQFERAIASLSLQLV